MAACRLIGVVLLWALSAACSGTRFVRLDTGQGPPSIHVPRADAAQPVELGQQEFTQALTKELRQKRPSFNPEKTAEGTKLHKLITRS